jgi:NAD(P)-dependent dehydrogenase (short-subunit alcohol dehydrogenase family)
MSILSAHAPAAALQRFTGKVIAVTGATAGIGAVTARRLAAEGGTVVLSGRNRDSAEALLAELGGERATFVAGDVRDRATADRVVGAALDRYGRLDVLVNNAAVDHTGDVLETPIEEVRALFDVNVFGAMHMLQAAGLAMREAGGGAIVNVSSRLASIGVPTMAMYSAAKGALLSLTRAAAVELAPRGIRVNAVAPGMTRTPLFEAWAAAEGDEVVARAAAAIPQGRFGTPEEVAAAIAFLASDEAAHITGASLPVDGGYTAA